MARLRCFLTVGVLSTVMLAAGCVAPCSAPFDLPGDTLSSDINDDGSPRLVRSPRLARSQQPEPPELPKLKPATAAPQPLAPPPLPGGTQAASLTTLNPVRMSIRAHVNGRPIFDDEVMLIVAPNLRYLQGVPESKRAGKLTELYNQALEKIIEDEVLYQDAVRKLERVNPRTLDKLKSLANDEFEKMVKQRRDDGIPENKLKELMPTWKKMTERNFIAVEYVRSRVLPPAKSRVGHIEIQEYYDTHKNEFQKVDTITWQDVFILAGGKLPTVAAARRYAEDLVAQCRTADDFVKLLPYDDGDAKLRGGAGTGQRRGEVKPAELEATLFQMREGQIEVVDIGTGVHIVRMLKRENAGMIPLNDATQQLIRRKLESQIINREYNRIVRELKQRAVIEIEQGS